jgi:L-methionine (R)-S-oxide reductase
MLDESTNAWLADLLARHRAVAGTVHVVRDDVLAAVDARAAVAELAAITRDAVTLP